MLNLVTLGSLRNSLARFAFVLACVLGSQGHALALTFTLHDVGTPPMSAPQLAAFNDAAFLWSSRFSDPINVVLNVAIDPPSAFPSPNVLGSASTQRATHSWDAVRTCLQADAPSGSLEDSVMAILQPGSPNGLAITDIDGIRIDNKITLSTANAKALMLTPTPDPVYGGAFANNADAVIRFNSAVNFDYDRVDGIVPGELDFTSVAAHEIGHALGFFSLTDVRDANPGPAFSQVLHPNTLDIWRFDDTNGSHDLVTEFRKVTAGPAEYFDTTAFNFENFSWGGQSDPFCQSTGGVCQSSHWRDQTNHLMDPTLSPTTVIDPDSFDNHAINYIGYDLVAGFPGFLRQSLSGGLTASWVPADGEAFDELRARPPTGADGLAKFEPTNGAVVELNIDLPGLTGLSGREAVALARFELPRENTSDVLQGLPDRDGEVNLFPETVRQEVLPATLTDFTFRTIGNNEEQPEISFVDSFSLNGTAFDETIGENGGYLISGFLDSTLNDDPAGDVDAAIYFRISVDGDAVPGLSGDSSFRVEFGEFDSIAIYDTAAFGAEVTFCDPTTMGDLDGDGQVAFPDFLVLSANFGMDVSSHSEGDIDCNGRVEFADFLILSSTFGQSFAPAEEFASVPEPSAFAITGLATAMLGSLRVRRHPHRS